MYSLSLKLAVIVNLAFSTLAWGQKTSSKPPQNSSRSQARDASKVIAPRAQVPEPPQSIPPEVQSLLFGEFDFTHAKIGNVIEAIVMRHPIDPTGRKRGFGFSVSLLSGPRSSNQPDLSNPDDPLNFFITFKTAANTTMDEGLGILGQALLRALKPNTPAVSMSKTFTPSDVTSFQLFLLPVLNRSCHNRGVTHLIVAANQKSHECALAPEVNFPLGMASANASKEPPLADYPITKVFSHHTFREPSGQVSETCRSIAKHMAFHHKQVQQQQPGKAIDFLVTCRVDSDSGGVAKQSNVAQTLAVSGSAIVTTNSPRLLNLVEDFIAKVTAPPEGTRNLVAVAQFRELRSDISKQFNYNIMHLKEALSVQAILGPATIQQNQWASNRPYFSISKPSYSAFVSQLDAWSEVSQNQGNFNSFVLGGRFAINLGGSRIITTSIPNSYTGIGTIPKFDKEAFGLVVSGTAMEIQPLSSSRASPRRYLVNLHISNVTPESNSSQSYAVKSTEASSTFEINEGETRIIFGATSERDATQNETGFVIASRNRSKQNEKSLAVILFSLDSAEEMRNLVEPIDTRAYRMTNEQFFGRNRVSPKPEPLIIPISERKLSNRGDPNYTSEYIIIPGRK